MVSTIATVLIHLIVVVFHTGIVSHGQILLEKENLIGSSKQSCGILMVRCPKLVKPILRHVFNRRFYWFLNRQEPNDNKGAIDVTNTVLG